MSIKPTMQRMNDSVRTDSVVEFRQYTLQPGQRDTLIDLFDQELVESQEEQGITIIGQFRDVNDPDRFVWLRGFPDMAARAAALTAFYGGPVWKAHREAANATMVDSDNVLLLRPARPASGFCRGAGVRPPRGATEIPGEIVQAVIYSLAVSMHDAVAYFEHALWPLLADAGASILAYFVTECSANTFPRLPVRESEQVLIWFARFRDIAAYRHHRRVLARSRDWQNTMQMLTPRLTAPPEVVVLSPTARSCAPGQYRAVSPRRGDGR